MVFPPPSSRYHCHWNMMIHELLRREWRRKKDFVQRQSQPTTLPLPEASPSRLTFALVVVMGEGAFLTIPPGCSWTGKKRRHCALRFWHAFPYINCATLKKISPRSSQVRSPGQAKWSYLENIYDCVVTTVFKVSICNFQELIKASIPTKRLSRNFDFVDLRSGQFWDLTIISQWENIQMPFSRKCE